MNRCHTAHLRHIATQGNGRQESQLGSLQHRLVHLHRQGCILQVGIFSQALLDELLQLRVGEDASPRQIAERGGILRCNCQRVNIADHIADESLGIDLGALILVI